MRAPIRQVTTSHGYGAKLVSGGKPGQYLLLWTSGSDGARHVFSRPLRL